MTRWQGMAAALALATALAGCSTDEAFNESAASVRATGARIAGAVTGRRAGGAVAAPPAATRESIDAAPRPIRFVSIEKFGATAPLAELSRNGDVTVFASQDGVQFALRDGVLIATRGLAVDLMSAAAPSAATLRRGTGAHGRAYFTLDGTNATVRADFRCTLETAGRETLQIIGLTVPTTLVVERCSGGGASFENRFWFDDRGRIRNARQWINPTLETVSIADPMR